MTNNVYFNRNEIAIQMGKLRDAIRARTARVLWKHDARSLKRETLGRFGFKIENDDWKASFSAETIVRFEHLWSVPVKKLDWPFPTPDQTARAVQNFINRRKNVWKDYEAANTPKEPTEQTYVSDAPAA